MIKDVHGNSLDSLWIAEFRGFFMAEGTLGIYRALRNRTKGYVDTDYYSATASIAQRDDNRKVLIAIQEKLGGTVTTMGGVSFTNPQAYNYMRKPQVCWRSTAIADIRRVIAILRSPQLPHLKPEIIDVVQQFLDLPRVIGRHTDPAIKEQMRALYAESKRLHQYRPDII